MEATNVTGDGQKPQTPQFTFSHDTSLTSWAIPMSTYKQTNSLSWYGIATGALVFDSSNRILLVQRTARDTMPNLWEFPGGGVDLDDPTVLYGCARELWEETGLKVKYMKRLVTKGPTPELARVITKGQGPTLAQVITTRREKKEIGKFVFEVEVEVNVQADQKVRLDSNEHQDFVWATEAEVKDEKVALGGTEYKAISFTVEATKSFILEGFRLRQEDFRLRQAM
ncbi:hypothetical protein QQS21_009751 [Conoideocrella luteorostrata]|uniref:Nudix hydrolase domain-containing protein n=1 Tax=Conoideocrella luteorostrata TaxID=1105319 RepID=A0AAJ0CKR5_9HYPO|nr:hypothetical protein QQS21_009751 [Conoideocrella luteorostrata]